MDILSAVTGGIELIKLANALNANPADLLERIKNGGNQGRSIYEITADLKAEYRAARTNLKETIKEKE